MPTAKNIILVTGATGFVGMSLCRRLSREGAYIRACGRNRADGPWQEFFEIDLADTGNYPCGLLDGVETIFHLGSKAHDLKATEAEVSGIIAGATRYLVQQSEAADIERFIYFSSVKAMGEGNPLELPLTPIDESWPHNPVSIYGCAKSEAEEIVSGSSIPHKVILRPVMVYGDGQKGNLSRMINAVSNGKFPPIPENGNKRSMIHVMDVAEFAVRAAQFPIANGKTYILASNSPISTRTLYDTIRESLDLPRQDWSIPMGLLRFAAALGSLASIILRRPLPLDLMTLQKLTSSAWYSSEMAQRELRYKPASEVRDWLLQKQHKQDD